jgi:hypothetical protein
MLHNIAIAVALTVASGASADLVEKSGRFGGLAPTYKVLLGTGSETPLAALKSMCLFMHVGDRDPRWLTAMQRQADTLRRDDYRIEFTIENYLGIQTDVSADFHPPLLGHQVRVEGTVKDAPRICGGIVRRITINGYRGATLRSDGSDDWRARRTVVRVEVP